MRDLGHGDPEKRLTTTWWSHRARSVAHHLLGSLCPQALHFLYQDHLNLVRSISVLCPLPTNHILQPTPSLISVHLTPGKVLGLTVSICRYPTYTRAVVHQFSLAFQRCERLNEP